MTKLFSILGCIILILLAIIIISTLVIAMGAIILGVCDAIKNRKR